jgi:hypothetical protein
MRLRKRAGYSVSCSVFFSRIDNEDETAATF